MMIKMDLLKTHMNVNHKITIEGGSSYHIIELTDDYVILKDANDNHEFKYYFDKDETNDLLFIESLQRLNKKKIKPAISCECAINIYDFDVFPKPKQTKTEKIMILKEALKLNNKYTSPRPMNYYDLWYLVDDKDFVLDILLIAKRDDISFNDAIKVYETGDFK